MRVSIIAEHYPPTAGGVATSAQRVARGLAAQGIDVEAFCFDDSRPVTAPPYLLVEHDAAVTVKRAGPFFLKQPREVLAQLDEKIKAAMRRQIVDSLIKTMTPDPPDVILSFYVLNAGFIAQFVGAALDVPVIAGVRGNDIGRNVFHTDRFAVTAWTMQRAAAIACVNAHLRQRLLWTWPEVASKIHVVPNSVAIPEDEAGTSVSDQRARRVEIRRDLGWPESSFVVAFVGTLREKKGATTLISALTRSETHDVRLLVVGPEIGPLERKLCGAGWDELKRVGRLFVTGQVPRKDVGKWLPVADAVVMPSVDDGMANGLLEGMAHGLCPIASDIFEDVVTDAVNGIIVPRGSAEALAAAIRMLSREPMIALNLGSCAREHMAHWTPAMEGQAYAKLIASVADVRVPNA